MALEQTELVSVVVPVFNETGGINDFHERTTRALESIPGARHELVYVDDGSADDSYAKLAAFAAADDRVRVIKLSRNFGHQIAITAGMDHTRGVLRGRDRFGPAGPARGHLRDGGSLAQGLRRGLRRAPPAPG